MAKAREEQRTGQRRDLAGDGLDGKTLKAAERERLRELERENAELRRANEILKAATAFFAQEADPTRPQR
jgi:transposase